MGRWAVHGRDERTSRLALLIVRQAAAAAGGGDATDDVGDAATAHTLAERIEKMALSNPARLGAKDSMLVGAYFETTGRLQDAGRVYSQYHGTQKYRVGQVDAVMNAVQSSTV